MTTAPNPDIAALREQAQALARVVRNRSQVAAVTFGADGDAMPDDGAAVTFTLFDSTGAVVIDAAPATASEFEVGAFTVAIPASAIPAVDLLTAVWATTVGGQPEQIVTTIEVCDRRLFTIAQARKFPELTTAKFTADQIEVERLAAEQWIEHECCCAFTGRYAVETHHLAQSYLAQSYLAQRSCVILTTLLLHHLDVTAIRLITIDGVALSSDDLAGVVTDRAGYLERRGGWGDVVTIGYEYGGTRPSLNAEAGRACLILARYRLLHGPLDDRAIALPVEGGGSVGLLTPGLRGSITGIPEIDVFVARHAYADGGVF